MVGRKANAKGRPQRESACAPKCARETLSLYKRRYTALIATIPSSLLLIGPDLGILAANRTFLRKARRTEKDTLGRKLDDVVPPVIVEQVNLKKQTLQVLETGEALTGRRMTYRAPGIPLRTYYYSIVPLIADGQPTEALLLMDDVTEQVRLSEEIRNVERHLASVVESASDIIVSTSPDSRVLSWNTAAEHLTGYGVEDVRGRVFSDLFSPASRQQAKHAFADLPSLEKLDEPEWGLVSRDGQEASVSWVFSIMRNESGGAAGVVAIGRDLTERRKLESQMLRAQKLAALGVMAGGIAHEIRNPLAVCNCAVQLLMEEDGSKPFVRECAEKIHNSILRASSIIENLLQFARPSATKKVARLDLCPLIHDTLAVAANEAKLDRVRLIEQTADAPLYVRGNAGLIQQLLMNLIVNALKAMPDGGVLTVGSRREGAQAVVTVSDTGCGMSQEQIDKAFDPFYTTRRVDEGTGLGLSLCYAIVKQHSGEIAVESRAGKGSTFTVRLPAFAP